MPIYFTGMRDRIVYPVIVLSPSVTFSLTVVNTPIFARGRIHKEYLRTKICVSQTYEAYLA
ncbi:hypothetical protein HOLleu_43152 [Holothuria leucospilota]|uniref:Uncharacterized protein n=1 Tax=Holothuria leucospilota TaxID=206669 RepID=A0A9Q0YAZ3_HOLLE|nr:hypothetical protein HOLleu_43152 [Holothuria leucospilota]